MTLMTVPYINIQYAAEMEKNDNIRYAAENPKLPYRIF